MLKHGYHKSLGYGIGGFPASQTGNSAVLPSPIYITHFINFTNAFCGFNVNDRLLQCVTKQNSTILIEKIADISIGKKKHLYFYGISTYD